MKAPKSLIFHQNPEIFFRTDHVKADLKGRSLRGGAVTLAAQGLNFALQTLGLLLLARFLKPGDFGLIGMVTIVIQFVLLIKDLGLTKAIIQREQINHQQVSSIFWINAIISSVLTLLVVASAPAVAAFYSEPRLTSIVMVLSIAVFFGGLPAQHQALLRRQMRFVPLALLEVAALLIGLITSLIFALKGAGYWSLVLWRLTPMIVIAIGSWTICGWRPGWFLWSTGVRSMLTFGGNIAGYRTFEYLSRNLDNILIGRYWGAQELGLYALAYRLLLLPIQQINAPLVVVALPALSRLQTDLEKYCTYYYKAILLITTLGMPVVGLTFVVADKAILYFLGEQWLDSVYLFWYLAPAAWIGTFNMAMNWAFASLDRTAQQLKWGIVSSVATAIIFFIGVNWGAKGVAIGYGMFQPLIYFIGFIYCYWGTPLKVTSLAKTIARPTIASVLPVVIIWAFQWTPIKITLPLLPNLCLTVGLYFLLYLGTWVILPNGKDTLLGMIAIAENAILRRKHYNIR